VIKANPTHTLASHIIAAVQHGADSGTGARILLIGMSRARKTLAIKAIANELGHELYRVDLNEVVGKYIGETEKNLNRIFSRANSRDAVLFFDEADSLFGNRTEVRDAHDRFANIQISYLLQRLEDYPGIAILATNTHEYVNDAFLRRCALILHLPSKRRYKRK
jgi:SpoVK/Ycf46/Vps4 family AAA+-type ATPase